MSLQCLPIYYLIMISIGLVIINLNFSLNLQLIRKMINNTLITSFFCKNRFRHDMPYIQYSQYYCFEYINMNE